MEFEIWIIFRRINCDLPGEHGKGLPATYVGKTVQSDGGYVCNSYSTGGSAVADLQLRCTRARSARGRSNCKSSYSTTGRTIIDL